MPRRVRIIHRRVQNITIPIKTLRVSRLRHNRIRADKPPNLRHIIPGIHVNQAQVVRSRVVMAVAGEAAAGDGRIAARRGGCERPEGIVAGF